MKKTKQSPLNLGSTWKYWKMSAANLIRMGHCAPTVMQTLLDLSGSHKEWLVKLSAGMPGGVGNTGFECGAVTSPLVMMGLRYGLHTMDRDLPVIFDRGHALCQNFLKCHKTLMCRQIRKDDHFPKRCIRPVCLSPQLFVASIGHTNQDVIPPATREAYSRIYSHWVEEKFHCAQTVLDQLHFSAPQDAELFNATAAFAGGTLLRGMTCSALAAGVMVVGLQSGEIENSPLRVMRLLFRMTFGGNAFDEKINRFNQTMNTGYRMSKWFVKEFGSTQCRAITQCDFSTLEGVTRYIERGCLARCREIAQRVARRVQETLAGTENITGAVPSLS
jgi:hypothetical protein